MELKTYSKMIVAAAGASTLLGIGYFFGLGMGEVKRVSVVKQQPAKSPLRRAPVEILQRRPLPIASVVLPLGEKLRSQNPDAYRDTYLDKHYRVIGIVERIAGTSARRSLDTDTVFALWLKPWISTGKPRFVSGPYLEVTDFSRKWALSLRPGHDIDADCLLESEPAFSFSFKYCRLNALRPAASASMLPPPPRRTESVEIASREQIPIQYRGKWAELLSRCSISPIEFTKQRYESSVLAGRVINVIQREGGHTIYMNTDGIDGKGSGVILMSRIGQSLQTKWDGEQIDGKQAAVRWVRCP